MASTAQDAELAARLHRELNGGAIEHNDPMVGGPSGGERATHHHKTSMRLADSDFNRMPHVAGDLDARDLK